MSKKYTIEIESYQEIDDLRQDLEARLQDFIWVVKEEENA